MNNIHRRRLFYALVIITALFTTACNKEWDEHYNEESFDLPAYSIFDYIETQSELSTFASMVKSMGYDTILNASQTFTVWAPTNSALSAVDLTNKLLVAKIVLNHIARNRYTTSMLSSKSVRMLSGKNVRFSRDGAGFTFGDKTIVSANLPTKNGLVFTLDEYVPYTQNIWEYIGSAESIDSVRSYMYGETEEVFHPELSDLVGINEDGNPVYDSVKFTENVLLERLGNISREDTTFTVILPNNDAWNEAYGRSEKYFNIPDIYGGAIRKRAITQWQIVEDVVYSGLVDDPTAYDSLVSTSGTVFHNPSYLFNDANKVKLSNGLAYVTGQLAFPDTISLINEIRVEAENTVGRLNINSNIFSRTYYDADVSNNRYILIEPTGTSNIALPSVTFSLPNTLSASYNIYCVFVPNAFSNPNDLLPQKAKFVLTYIRQTTGRTSRKTFTPDVTMTDPNGLTKLFVGQFDFEFANIIDEDYPEVLVTMQVTSEVKIDEAESFSRSMRIDCIILEPVIQ